MKTLTEGLAAKLIKTWQEKLDTVSDERIVSSLMIQHEMQAEIDELRAALQERDAEIRLLKASDAAWKKGWVQAETKLAAQRRVLEQALEALNDITSEISMKRFWREKDEKRFDEIAEEAITAIQEQLA